MGLDNLAENWVGSVIPNDGKIQLVFMEINAWGDGRTDNQSGDVYITIILLYWIGYPNRCLKSLRMVAEFVCDNNRNKSMLFRVWGW